MKTWWKDAADLLAEPDPGPTPWLVDGLMVDQALITIVGKWKTTKSYGLLDLCISIATGQPAFGTFDIPEPGPVIFVNEESGWTALRRRLDSLCRGRAIKPDDLRGRLLLAANAGVKLDAPDWQERVLELGREIKPRLIAFDPLARMKAASRDEKDQSAMAVLIEYLRNLRGETESAVAIVHHTGHDGDHMRGSSDLESYWETQLKWERNGKSSLVTIKSEHREAEAAATIKYRIGWDATSRSMRFDLDGSEKEDDLAERVSALVAANPEMSANKIYEQLQLAGDGAERKKVLALVKTSKEGGSDIQRTTANHPSASGSASGSDGGVYRPPRTTTADDGSEPQNHGAPDEVAT